MEGGALQLLTSGGGLKDAGDYRPIDSLLSGPAGGVRGAQSVARSAGCRQVIAFDMEEPALMSPVLMVILSCAMSRQSALSRWQLLPSRLKP